MSRISSCTHRAGESCASANMRRHSKVWSTIWSTCSSPASVSSMLTSNDAKSECERDSPATSWSAHPLALSSESREPSVSWPSRCEM